MTGFFREHGLQAKVAGEFDGVSSLVAALEGNLGIALLAQSSRIDNGSKQRLTSLPLSDQTRRIEVAAGVTVEPAASVQVVAFIEELKQAAKES